MKKRTSMRTLSDAFLRAKPKAKGAKPARISLTTGVLGRTGRMNDCRIHDRARRDADAACIQMPVHPH